MRNLRAWSLKSRTRVSLAPLALAAASAFVFPPPVAWAEEGMAGSSEIDTPAPSADDGYSFKWLDPDKKIYVLQNRRYTKAGRGMLSVIAGPGSSNAYRNTAGVSLRGGFFFSEWLGLEIFHTLQSNSDNGTFQSLKAATANIIPIVREIKSQTGVVVNFVPWYAKINMFNEILYFDWYFSVGGGSVMTRLDTRTNALRASSYVDQTFTGIFASTGHLYHLSQLFAVRLDVSGAYYNAPNSGLTGEKSWFSNYLYSIGFALKL